LIGFPAVPIRQPADTGLILLLRIRLKLPTADWYCLLYELLFAFIQ
jgi:hypothetical protein